MNDIVFTHVPNPPGFIFFDHNEPNGDIPTIQIVENFDSLRYMFKLYGLASWIKDREKYRTYDEYVEINMENSITHETLHYLLLNMEGEKANAGLDRIDCTTEGYQSLR